MIRRLVEQDAEDYQRLRLEALQVSPEAFGSSYEREAVFTMDEVRERIAPRPWKFTLGAYEGGSLVGMATFVRELGPKTQHKGNIYGMYVSPAYRGLGKARLLLEKLFEEAEGLDGLEQLTLTVVSDNAAAKSLYKDVGFTVFGTEKNALKVGGIYYAEDWMVYFL